MILHRLSQSLKSQHWMAIAIELIVVVLGVFIGLQASNWNEDRETERKAAVFTERLRADLLEEAWSYESQIAYSDEVLANAQRAANALSGIAPLSDEALLVAAYRATQYSLYIRRRATYDELTSTGEIGLIRDWPLRKLAMDVYTAQMFDDITAEGKSSEYRHWFRLNVPHEVQQALLNGCGDKVVEVGDYKGIHGSLDYPCSTGLTPDALAAAASILRNDKLALPLLRLRLADVRTNVDLLAKFFDYMRKGLQQLAKEQP